MLSKVMGSDQSSLGLIGSQLAEQPMVQEVVGGALGGGRGTREWKNTFFVSKILKLIHFFKNENNIPNSFLF